MSTCSRYGVDAVILAACSGHGDCTPEGACMCSHGWTSRIDFWPDPTFDCDTSLAFITVLAWLILVTRAVLVPLACLNVYKLDNWKLTTLRQAKARVCIYWLLEGAGDLLWVLPKIVDPEAVVGLDIVCSAGSAVNVTCHMAGWCAFIAVIIKFLSDSGSAFSPVSREMFLTTVAPFSAILPWIEAFTVLSVAFPIAASYAPANADGKVLIRLR